METVNSLVIFPVANFLCLLLLAFYMFRIQRTIGELKGYTNCEERLTILENKVERLEERQCKP